MSASSQRKKPHGNTIALLGKRNNPNGRTSIFAHKTHRKITGYVTPEGSAQFEVSRGRLARLAHCPVDLVSTNDVLEFLARGVASTKAYLQVHPFKGSK